jgi:hypothetical protein
MEIKRIIPVGRVPRGEPGYNFQRGKNPKDGKPCAVPPLQKGETITPENAEYQWIVDAAGFCEGGDYTVFQVTDGDGIMVGEHIVCALRNKGVPHLWLVQQDHVFQANGAMAMLEDCQVENPADPEADTIKFEWAYWCSALASVQEARRVLIRTQNMFPELKWAMFWDVGDGQMMTGQPTDYAKGIRDSVDQGKRDKVLEAAMQEVEGMN